MNNPLLSLGRPLPFDRIQASHVVPAIRELIVEASARLDALSEAQPTYASTLAELDAATERLELSMGVVEHLEGVATTPAFREAYNTVLPEVSAFWSSIPLRENLFRALLAFAESEEARALDRTRSRLLEKTLAEFRRHGATLPEAGKKRLAELDRELGLLTNKFSQNVLDATNAFELLLEDAVRLSGLPVSAIEAAKQSASQKGRSGYRLTLQGPALTAVLTYADDASLRQELWQAHSGRATTEPFDNRPLIAEVLRLRHEKAKLLGFRDFADLVTEDRMAKNGAKARGFVDDLAEKTRAAFERENSELEAFRKKLEGPEAPLLHPWDVAYYAEKLRRERYDLDEEELRQYFASDRVLRGAFDVAHRLFGVKIEPSVGAPTWDSEVKAYVMTDPEAQSTLGTFYVDLYPRENKRSGAWMHGIVAAVPPDAHAAVFCANASPPVGDKPSLLTHRDVETLFHEFGHLLHHCLSRVEVRSLSCTRVAQDFVELPSQIMENWCSERDALNLFARHFETDEVIPERLLSRLRAARTFRAANAQMRQLGFAAVDLALHVDYDPVRDGDVMRYARDVLSGYAPTSLPDDYGMIASFMHLFGSPVGYAAGYYSYKWAEVLDADAFSRFRSEGILNGQVGAEFREKVLALGDSQDPMQLFKSFMGREPRPEALLERQGLAA